MIRFSPTFSLFLLLISSAQLNGQVNSYFENNPKWIVQSQCAIPYPCIETKTYMHFIQGDTVLDGVEYKVLSTFGESSLLYYDNDPTWCSGSETFYGPSYLIRSENRRMYIRSGDEDLLLYDFNLEVGDTLPETFMSVFDEPVIVSGIDSIEVDGEYYERFALGDLDPLYLVEGIGSYNGLLSPMGAILECGFILICYRQNNTVYFETDTGIDCELTVSVTDQEMKPSISIFPHPLTTNSRLELTGFHGPVIVTLHDVTGKLVSKENHTTQSILLERNNLQPGIYLLSVSQNGRNVIATKLLVGR